ncbi:MAG TPA: TIM barrel protein [Armatimonadota bacterium]|nr:TIM barrel protein [Armatimonadota bacterium]
MLRTYAAGLVAGAMLCAAAAWAGGEGKAAKPSGRELFAPGNLVAWCIVPFDAKMRGPEERAEMMQRLGIKHFAYDWRAEHIPTFDQELDALQKRGISLDAFWFPSSLEPEKDPQVKTILDFLRRRGVKTQLWVSLGLKDEGTQEERVETAARPIRWIAEEAAKIGCSVGLYNHGGWFGEPENQIAIIERVKLPNVGVVYNFHHGHEQLDRFPELFAKMKPHLLALNINGMRKGGPKILGVGKGDRELEMLRRVAGSDYQGLIGILGHREELDAEVALRENLEGLQSLRKQLP